MVLNPAAFTHYSYALRDACAQLRAPLIEVHLTNPATREEFRHTSVVAGVATGTIAGFGVRSYDLALQAWPRRCRLRVAIAASSLQRGERAAARLTAHA